MQMIETLILYVIWSLGLMVAAGLMAALGSFLVFLAAFVGDFFDQVFGSRGNQ